MQRPLKHLIILSSTALGLTACAVERSLPSAPTSRVPVAHVAPDAAAPAVPDSPWRAEFERAAAGLWYSSEADYPFEFFFMPATVQDALDQASFRGVLGLGPETPIDERDLDQFFAHHIERVDRYDAASLALVPRYEQLKFTVEEALNYRRVFCVGQTVLRCYVVGTDESGNIVGLVTTAVET